MGGLTVGDWVQIGGLAVNAGLLGGLVLQIRIAARSRRVDEHSTRQRATLDAWAAVSDAMRESETLSRTYFGRLPLTPELARQHHQAVLDASRRREHGEPDEDGADVRLIAANESVRHVLNATQDFVKGVDLGAYDRETAQSVAGWRIARVVSRHLAYIEVLRTMADAERAFGSLQGFAEEFLRRQGVELPNLPVRSGAAERAVAP